MDPLRPVDPDEEFRREAADMSGTNDSDVETPAEIQSAAAPERRPADDGIESTDDPVRGESDSIVLPPSEASSTHAELLPSDGADAIPSSDLAMVPNDAAPEPPSAFLDSAPAAGEADLALDARQLPLIEPVDTALSTDLIPPPDNSGSDASTDRAIDRAIPPDSWPEASSDFYAALQEAHLPVIDPGNSDALFASPDTGSSRDRSSPTVDQKPSREGSLDDSGKHDTAPVKDDKSDQVVLQPESSAVEGKRKAVLREEIERFIENFYAQMARADALLSPPFGGGPPMARPIVLVSLDEEQMQSITNDVLAESGSRLAKTAAEVAEDKVNEAFWLRDCEMRALYRGR